MASPPIMPAPPPSAGAIPFVPNATLDRMQTAADEAQRQQTAAASPDAPPQFENNLYGYVRMEYETMRMHRSSSNGWDNRMLAALRMFSGQYEPSHLNEIRKFGGSDGYLRVVAMKCRGASSLLRDVYLSTERPWGLTAPSDPDMPVEMIKNIVAKVDAEVADATQGGEQLDEAAIRDRMHRLVNAAKEATKKKAAERVELAEDKVDDLLREGNFYGALADFLTDLPLFPFACLKGPEVRVNPVVTWKDGKPSTELRPRLCYERISPFDIWFTPGVTDIADADVIERVRFTRAMLGELLDLPGFDHENIRKVLQEYQNGHYDEWEGTDSTRAALESRENPLLNRSRLINGRKFSGCVQGLLLLQQGMDPEKIPDPLRDYAVEAWYAGRHLIKLQLAASTTRRHIYYITSFEKVPGTTVGNALPDIMGDVQDGINAAWRSLINNMAMASGPQVVVLDDRLSGSESGDDIYPWKRWHAVTDPFATSSTANKPVDFFQPDMHASELMQIITFLFGVGDDMSAIPRYLQGNSPGGGAGRTASGLAMLMGNASKILQTVCANIDRDVIDQVIRRLVDMILLTDTTDMLDGTEQVQVKGVTVAMQRETQRTRQLEFLQITGNPVDMSIMGIEGRAAVLRRVSDDLGLQGEQVVPDADVLQQRQQQQALMAQTGTDPAAQAGGAPGGANQKPRPGVPSGGTGGGGMPPPVQSSTLNAGPRTNLVGARRQAAPV